MFALPAKNCGGRMCNICKQIDDKIAHYRRMEIYIGDKLILDGLRQLIQIANAEKAELRHGEEK